MASLYHGVKVIVNKPLLLRGRGQGLRARNLARGLKA